MLRPCNKCTPPSTTLQEMHTKAWDLVGSYLKTNLETFTGKSLEAESTILPSVVSWIQDTLSDVPESLHLLWGNKYGIHTMPILFLDVVVVCHVVALTQPDQLLSCYLRNTWHAPSNRPLGFERALSKFSTKYLLWIVFCKEQPSLVAKEVKATDDHCVVLWCNMTTVGVMPAAKYDFFLTSITNILATHKRNGLALIVHCNRASDTGRTGHVLFTGVFLSLRKKLFWTTIIWSMILFLFGVCAQRSSGSVDQLYRISNNFWPWSLNRPLGPKNSSCGPILTWGVCSKGPVQKFLDDSIPTIQYYVITCFPPKGGGFLEWSTISQPKRRSTISHP